MDTYIVDSFTDEPFKGNPAGVCFVQSPLNDVTMQNIAKELRHSETAFVTDEGDHFSIRYFSPITEIPLCGHATLAASKAIFDRQREGQMEASDSIRFLTKSNVELKTQLSGDQIEMHFPVYPTHPVEVPDALLDALGLAVDTRTSEAQGNASRIVAAVRNDELNIVMLHLHSADELKNLAPDFDRLVGSYQGVDGVLVTAAADDEFDFHSRYFWPWSGGDEDPVTGATHTFMAKYWADRLGKKRLRSFQASQRTGQMELELNEAGLIIRSHARIVLKGQWVANQN